MKAETFHLSASIDWLLNKQGPYLGEMFTKTVDGKKLYLSAEEARCYLYHLRAEGKKLLPLGQPCEGFSYITGCPGHPHEEDNATKAQSPKGEDQAPP